jgi:hypothetical protein
MKKHSIDLSGWRGVTTKVLIVLAVILGMMGIALKLIERAKEPLRQGIEQHMSESSGMIAGIDELAHATFLPDVDFRIKNVVFRARDNDNPVRVQIEKLAFAMPFWSLMTGQPKIRNFYLSGLKAEPGVWTPYALALDEFMIRDEDGEKPGLTAAGRYDGRPLRFDMELSAAGKKGDGRTYKVSDLAPFSLAIGQVTLTGVYQRGKHAPLLKDAVLSGNGKSYGPRDMALKRHGAPDTDILSCLLAQRAAAVLTDAHACALLFKDAKDKVLP